MEEGNIKSKIIDFLKDKDYLNNTKPVTKDDLDYIFNKYYKDKFAKLMVNVAMEYNVNIEKMPLVNDYTQTIINSLNSDDITTAVYLTKLYDNMIIEYKYKKFHPRIERVKEVIYKIKNENKLNNYLDMIDIDPYEIISYISVGYPNMDKFILKYYLNYKSDLSIKRLYKVLNETKNGHGSQGDTGSFYSNYIDSLIRILDKAVLNQV